MSKDKGYSREGFFGTIYHYDSKGHKIGESRPRFFGGYTNFDSKGHKIGTSEEKFFGGGFTHFDNAGHKIGSSDERLFGGCTNRDASGHVTGSTERSVFDIKSPEEIAATGSLYGSNLYPGGSPAKGATGPAPAWRRRSHPNTDESDEEPTEFGFVKGEFIFPEDMALLRDAGYNEFELDCMDFEEFREVLEKAGVDIDLYDFEKDEEDEEY